MLSAQPRFPLSARPLSRALHLVGARLRERMEISRRDWRVQMRALVTCTTMTMQCESAGAPLNAHRRRSDNYIIQNAHMKISQRDRRVQLRAPSQPACAPLACAHRAHVHRAMRTVDASKIISCRMDGAAKPAPGVGLGERAELLEDSEAARSALAEARRSPVIKGCARSP